MLVSVDKGIIYYHYPKTGGCTVQKTLHKYNSYVSVNELITKKFVP